MWRQCHPGIGFYKNSFYAINNAFTGIAGNCNNDRVNDKSQVSSVIAVTEEYRCYPFVLGEHYHLGYFRKTENYLPF